MVIVGKLNTAQQLEIIYRLENQIDEIQSLRWQHVSAESDAWPLLSSGSRDASLVIWDVPKEEVYQKITPPKDNQTTKSQQSRVFTVAAWAIHIPERLFFTTFK
jgi:WD40 repeat protein